MNNTMFSEDCQGKEDKNVAAPYGVATFWWERVDSLFCGKATPVATCRRHVAKSRLSNPPSIENRQPLKGLPIFWWERVDSNHRSLRNRFTVCPLWPLGNAPILNCLVPYPDWPGQGTETGAPAKPSKAVSLGKGVKLALDTPRLGFPPSRVKSRRLRRLPICPSLRSIRDCVSTLALLELVDGLEPPTC